MPMYYVYGHFIPGSPLPFYVGKGKGQRAKQKSRRSVWWHNVANKHGYEVRMLASSLTEAEAHSLECFWIALWGRRNVDAGGILINLTAGGEGASGRQVSEESRAKMRHGLAVTNANPTTRANKAAAQRGKRLSPETRAKMSASRKGIAKTAEHRAKISAALQGRQSPTWADERKAAMADFQTRQTRSSTTRAKMAEARRRWWAAKKAQQEA